MGLDLFSGDRHVRVGSYHSTQMSRCFCIRAMIAAIQLDHHDKEWREHIVEDLEACLPDADADGYHRDCPDYDMVENIHSMHTGEPELDRALAGLAKWVDHSDCDGTLSVGDASDVHAMLVLIRPHADIDGTIPDWGGWCDRMIEFFANTDETVLFG